MNQQTVEVNAPADRTALQYLRASGLTGTKEGCASGDCGACTVMVGELKAGKVQFKTINSCIVPIGQLAGTHVVTVEGLADQSGLHPVQDEMVVCHGSQCGFCTPGFVMSLAAMLENGDPAKTETVQQGISGNLCRCTGYRPIVQAGMNALGRDYESRLQDPGLLNDIKPASSGSVQQPLNESALRAVMVQYPRAPLIAGGTDLMLEVTQRYQGIERLIDVSRVKELRLITETQDTYGIGASVTYTELEAFFAPRSPALVSLLHRFGSRQIRNSGTIGGNLANGSPIADMPPILICWDATLELCSSSGQTREVDISEFYTGYRQTVLKADEYIAGIRIPKRSLNSFTRCYKSSKRIEDDISSVMGAFLFEGDSSNLLEGGGSKITAARIAFGGMAATPVRLTGIEDRLVGKTVSEELLTDVSEALGEAMSPLTDVRASAEYRTAMARSMVVRALNEFSGISKPLVMELELHA
ncbi:MAG: xanthine dehydrogenase small subunit [Gammaproteobacteria bacterium]|nr:xanthine dehydrogenase small subunit [Gammaproteobacteria bacterium]